MFKILITGAKGQLGSEIRQIQNNFPDFCFIFTDIKELDITKFSDINLFYKKHKFDFIVNCAAYTNVDKAETDFENAYKINAQAVKNLSEISKEYKIPLIHISTDYVFDGKSNIPYTENEKVNPQSVYGKTKLKGEEFAKDAYNHIIIRTSWLYSSFGNNFLKTMIKLGKERESINVVADQIGSPTFAGDLALAVIQIIKKISVKEVRNISGIYHYSNEGSCSWYEFAKEIMKESKINCKVNPIPTQDYPTPAKRPKYSLLDKTKIKKTFDVAVPFWKDSLKVCINSLLNFESDN